MWPLLQARSTGERGYWQVLRRSQCNRGALAWVSSPKSKKHRNRRLSFPRQWECLPTSMDLPPPQWHSGGTGSVWPTTENGLLDLRASNLGTRLCFVWKDKSYGVSHISREVPPARQLQAQESGNEKRTVACASKGIQDPHGGSVAARFSGLDRSSTGAPAEGKDRRR